ncbi:MAG: hypothetical protein ACOYM2_08270 [Rectinemataceae bacterium]
MSVVPILGPRGFLYLATSRRSGGLSLGVNLFAEGKRCNFDCAYCEVVKGGAGDRFSVEGLEEDLEGFAASASSGALRGEPLRDISIAGDGEPTLSPLLGEAIEAIAAAKSRHPEVFGQSAFVLITNSTGLAVPKVAEFLEAAVRTHGLLVWAKLDAGSQSWFRSIDRSPIDFTTVLSGLEAFAQRTPVIIQSMFCALAVGPDAEPSPPPAEELDNWIDTLVGLLERGARVGGIQLYTQARPAPLGITAPLEGPWMRAFAHRVRTELQRGGHDVTVRVYGSGSELEIDGDRP